MLIRPLQDILEFIKQAQERVLSHLEDQALLKAYIAEWRKFFAQCSYLPMPFGQLESALQGKTTSLQKGKQSEESVVRKLMLDTWNLSIFSNIKERLQTSAMKLVHNERNGEAFDSQLVIGVRESYVNLCSNPSDKLQIYRDNFERAYIQVRYLQIRRRPLARFREKSLLISIVTKIGHNILNRMMI